MPFSYNLVKPDLRTGASNALPMGCKCHKAKAISHTAICWYRIDVTVSSKSPRKNQREFKLHRGANRQGQTNVFFICLENKIQIRIQVAKNPRIPICIQTLFKCHFSQRIDIVCDLSLALFNPTNLLTSPQNARTQLNNLYSNVYCTLVGYDSGPMEARSVFGWQRKRKKLNLEV